MLQPITFNNSNSFWQHNDLSQNNNKLKDLEDCNLKRKKSITDLDINDDKENNAPFVSKVNISAEKTNTYAKRNIESPKSRQLTPKKITRRYEHISSAPSVMQDESDKILGNFNTKLIQEHAFMRIQLFAVAVVGIYGLGIRSDGSEDPEFKLDLISAYLQVGTAKNIKGKGKVKNQFHAAHDNAAAGYIDNARERAIKTIASEHVITPTKKQRLAIKGFSDADFQQIQENYHDSDKIEEIFNKAWPINPKRPQSIFTGTSTDLILNSTTEAEIGINLVVDKWIETLRPEIKKLYEQIIYKKITQEEACIQYRDLIINHLSQFEKHHEINSVNLVRYEEEFSKLEQFINFDKKNITETQINQIKVILECLRSLQMELDPPKQTNKKTKTNVGDDVSCKNAASNPKKPRAKLPKNKKFLNESLYELRTNKEDPTNRFSIWMVKKYDDLKKEFQIQKEKIQAYIKFSAEERTGTVLPDFNSLFGEFDSKTETRVLTENSYNAAQKSSWTPTSTSTST